MQTCNRKFIMFIMLENNLGTVGGKPINQNMLDDYAETFAKDWSDSEIKFAYTERRKALNALGSLNIPIYEIEALERRAVSRQQSLSAYVHSILKQELLAVSDL